MTSSSGGRGQTKTHRPVPANGACPRRACPARANQARPKHARPSQARPNHARPNHARPSHAHSTASLLISSLLLCSLPFALAGCGVYNTRPGNLPSHIRTIAIPTFENLTTQAGLDDGITRSVVDRFVADNNLRVVGEPEADAVLSGAVTGYENAVFGFTGNVQAEEYRVSITVSCRLFDKAKNREIWQDEHLTKTANYYVVEVPGQPAQTEVDGRQEAIQKISDEILSRTVDVW